MPKIGFYRNCEPAAIATAGAAGSARLGGIAASRPFQALYQQQQAHGIVLWQREELEQQAASRCGGGTLVGQRGAIAAGPGARSVQQGQSRAAVLSGGPSLARRWQDVQEAPASL
jgi:hypothetical protein